MTYLVLLYIFLCLLAGYEECWNTVSSGVEISVAHLVVSICVTIFVCNAMSMYGMYICIIVVSGGVTIYVSLEISYSFTIHVIIQRMMVSLFLSHIQ